MPKCISVRLASFSPISNKCYKAVAFDGSEALIPASQFYGQDYSVTKSNAYWITEWILGKVHLQHSNKKWTIFSKDGHDCGQIEFKHHIPQPIKKEVEHNKDLFK